MHLTHPARGGELAVAASSRSSRALRAPPTICALLMFLFAQNLRVAQVANGAASKLAKISVVRKSIARVLTVISQKARNEMRSQVKDKKTVQVRRAEDWRVTAGARAAARRGSARARFFCLPTRALPPSLSRRFSFADPEAAAEEADARHPTEVDAQAGKEWRAWRAGWQ